VQSAAEIGLGLDAGGRFQLRWTPDLHVRRFGPAPTPVREELLRGVERVEFAYWRDGWQTSWDRPDLPTLIRIRLVFAAKDGRHWPDIVIAPLRKRSD
jgi:general secretion pathway protein J